MKREDIIKIWERLDELPLDQLEQLKQEAAKRIRWARHAFTPKHSRNFIGSDPRFKEIFPKTKGYSEYKFKDVENGEFGKGEVGFREFIEGIASFYNVEFTIFIDTEIDQIRFQKMIRTGWLKIEKQSIGESAVLNG